MIGVGNIVLVMDIALKLTSLFVLAGLLLYLVVVVDKRIRMIHDFRWRLLAQSFVYAFAFTPTAYHYSPNTIIAPLHLSTVSGNLFYSYEYTLGMFTWGVFMPILFGWAVCFIFMAFRLQLPKSV